MQSKPLETGIQESFSRLYNRFRNMSQSVYYFPSTVISCAKLGIAHLFSLFIHCWAELYLVARSSKNHTKFVYFFISGLLREIGNFLIQRTL